MPFKNNEDHLEVLREVKKNPNFKQRELANHLGFSLGKLNYCLNELKNKGLIKINNFKKNPKKLNYIYVLTPKGITAKTKLTIEFMKRKMKEYDELKKELRSK
jgi:MarR family transcriptional regulator, temperature-dependent positive regulator of motility